MSKINDKLQKVFDKVDALEEKWEDGTLNRESLENVTIEVLQHFNIRTFGGQLDGDKLTLVNKILMKFDSRFDD